MWKSDSGGGGGGGTGAPAKQISAESAADAPETTTAGEAAEEYLAPEFADEPGALSETTAVAAPRVPRAATFTVSAGVAIGVELQLDAALVGDATG